jgi:hypothetical protein
MHDIIHIMQNYADSIRSFASRFVDAARRNGESEVSIVAGQIHRELHLNNRVPAVCSALASKPFQERNRIVLIKREGPKSGQSTTTKYTYRLTDSASTQGTEVSDFLALRGAGKDVFEALGGGETFLKSERSEFGDR